MMIMTRAVCATWIFLWVTCSLWQSGMLERILVDMTGQGCFDLGERSIKDDQVYSVYADYQPNQQPTMDHCDVAIRATERNRRLQYLIDKLTIFDCGITIWIYDNPQLVSQPSREIKCDDDRNLPLQGTTSHEVIKISLRKESTQATAFEFQIHVKTNYGPPFDFEKDSSSFYEQPLDTGAIVGIVIAGSIFLIALAGLAIYCCLKARMNRKHAEASEAPSAASVYTTGTSRVLYQGTNNQRSSKNGERFHRPASQDSSGKLSSKDKASVYTNNLHKANKDTSIHTANQDRVDTNKNRRVYANEVFEDEQKFNRQASIRHSQKRRQNNASFDDTDHTNVKGGHVSRRDSSRGSGRAKYDKKTKYSRHDDYGSLGKAKKQPVNGVRKSRSRSPGSQGSFGSTVDSNALVYGYSKTSGAHPNTSQDSNPQSRARSRSRTRGSSQRSGSNSRSRADSWGRSDRRDAQRTVPKNVRQYGDMSDFLPDQQQHHRARSRSGSTGRRSQRR